MSLPGLASHGSSMVTFLLASPSGCIAAVLVSRLARNGGFRYTWSEPSVCSAGSGVQGQGEGAGDVLFEP